MERGVRLSQVGYIKSRQLLFVYTAVEDMTLFGQEIGMIRWFDLTWRPRGETLPVMK